MKILKEVKIFSVCDDFEEEEKDLYDYLTKHVTTDSYISWGITYFGDDPTDIINRVTSRLIELGAKEGEEVFIEIDY